MAYTTINKPSLHFNTVLYTGNGTTQSITGVGFRPDFVWLKNRSLTYHHGLWDSVRGATNAVYSSVTNAEGVESGVSAFNSDGFSVGSSLAYNKSSDLFVGWNWLGANTTVANTAGTISSTVSANTTSGFSIVTYTSPNSASDQTVGHGLGVVPSFIITKNLDNTYNWDIHHKSLSSGNGLLFTTDVPRAGVFGSMTSTTFGTKNSYTHASTNRYIAYCFADVKGFSKFGSYTGNGNADGTFVYTGFKPAFIMIKQTNASGEGWFILDNKRETINPLGTLLIANDSGADNTSQNPILDFTSNGFKLRRTWSGVNGSGATYVYMAFAEQPLVGTNNIPCTAR